ncbi:SGNH hydrolase [Wilcoxina mikolae CBS 423.85]|nr:SGNH hydrolase [Wilcoxina mikolae CBS 423.85]
MVPISQLLLPAILAPAASCVKILMAGDSTMAHITSPIQDGWGFPFQNYTSLSVVNLARGGRSSRSYTREGLWANLVTQIDAGDYVIIEFGHNDAGTPQTSDRAPTPGTGTETTTITLADGRTEVVQTFVTYEKNMVKDVLAKGGIPIIASQTPDGDAWNSAHTKMQLGSTCRFVMYAQLAAQQSGANFIDHWTWVTRAYENLGYDNVYPKLFRPGDHTHTIPAGADVVAKAFVNGLKCTKHPLADHLTIYGEDIPLDCP